MRQSDPEADRAAAADRAREADRAHKADPAAGPASEPDPDREAGPESDGPTVNPAGFCHGPGLIVVYGNPAFKRVFGDGSVGLPAREGMLGLSRTGFTLLDAVLRQGRPLARWTRLAGETWRMTAAPRVDPGTGEIYGVAFHLRPRDPAPPEGRN